MQSHDSDDSRRSEGAPRPSSWQGLWMGLGFAAGLLGLIVLASLALGTEATASDAWWSGHGRHRHGRFESPEEAREHARTAARWLLRYVGASDEQHVQVEAILDDSIVDLYAIVDDYEEPHDALREALAQESVDPAAIEAIRVSQMEAAEGVSRRLAQAVIDLAEVLSPEQRSKLVELADRLHGR